MAKICVISGDFPPKARGTGYSAFKIAKFLKVRYKHEIIVITRTMVQSDEIHVVNEIIKPFFQRDYYQNSKIAKIYRIVIPKIPLFQILINNIKVQKILNIERPEIAIIVTPGVYSFPNRKIPYIIKNGGSIYVYNAHRRFDSPYSAYIKIFGALLYKLEKHLFSHAEKVISVSSFETRVVKSVYHINEQKLTQVLNGINMLIPNPPILKRKEIKRIIYVGQLNEIKGIKYLLEAFVIIAPKYPEITLDVIGEGSFDVFLKEYVKKKRLTNRIFFRGYLPQKKLQDYYAVADLAVVPSIHDACPNTVLEAFGYGIPVIGSRVGGIPELITHRNTGMLFTSKNAEVIGKTLSFLLENPQTYRNLINTLILERENMTWLKRIEGIEKVIHEVLSKNSNRH